LRVTEIGRDQMIAISDLVAEALKVGRTVDQVARDIRSVVGLHSRQVKTLMKYRETLVDRGLSPERIENLMSRRAKGMLASRAKIIARTEIVDAANVGQRALWDEAVSRGILDKKKTFKVWLTTTDDLAEEHCLELHLTEVLLDEQFSTGLGNVDGPKLHPNCRCGLKIRIERG
jgi:hypothetical protein